MKRLLILTVTLALGILFAAPLAAQKSKTPLKNAAPKNVIDVLRILPAKYSQIITANPKVDRLSLIKVDERKTNFLRLEAENFVGFAEIALFPKKSGGFLIAVNEYAQNSAPMDGGVTFYQFDKGKWSEVDPFPRFSTGDLRTAFHGKTKRQPTEEEMENRYYELHQPNAKEITLKIAGEAVYGFVWNGTDFDSGMIYLLDEK